LRARKSEATSAAAVWPFEIVVLVAVICCSYVLVGAENTKSIQIDNWAFVAHLFWERAGGTRAIFVFVFGEPIKKGLKASALRGQLNPALGLEMMSCFCAFHVRYPVKGRGRSPMTNT
jgi:hypothetical protein